MTANDTVLRRYYRAVRGWLPGSRKLRKQVIGQLRDSVASYLEQEPDADFSQVRAYFGEPQAIAAAYVDSADTMELLRSLRIRRRIVTTVTAAAAAALILWAGVVTYIGIRVTYEMQNATIIVTTHEEGQTPDPNAVYTVP